MCITQPNFETWLRAWRTG